MGKTKARLLLSVDVTQAPHYEEELSIIRNDKEEGEFIVAASEAWDSTCSTN